MTWKTENDKRIDKSIKIILSKEKKIVKILVLMHSSAITRGVRYTDKI